MPSELPVEGGRDAADTRQTNTTNTRTEGPAVPKAGGATGLRRRAAPSQAVASVQDQAERRPSPSDRDAVPRRSRGRQRPRRPARARDSGAPFAEHPAHRRLWDGGERADPRLVLHPTRIDPNLGATAAYAGLADFYVAQPPD